MAYELMEVTTEAEFDELVQVEFLAFDHPPNPLRPLFFPIFGEGPDARAQAVRTVAHRVFTRHQQTAGSHWVKAVDARGQLVGAALWLFFERDPYSGQPWPHCTWWPRGEGRNFANQWAWGIRWPRVRYMSKPHVYLNLCFVHPEARRRGIGRRLLQWGLERADALGLESYMDASAAGRPLYESLGFVAGPSVLVDFTAPQEPASDLWRELATICLPHRFWPMWRPIQGRFPESSRRFMPAEDLDEPTGS